MKYLSAGCMYGNSTYEIGEFYIGCEEKCMCESDGSVKCTNRCSLPYSR